MSLHLTAVVAMTSHHVIGKNGKLPWHLPEDLAFFKKTTTGHPIVMGRKTYESIGHALPNRRNIVLTRDRDWSAKDVEVIYEPDDLAALTGLDGQVFIIGGAEIYAAFLPKIDDLLVSHVFENHEGDTWFPEFEREFPDDKLVERHTGFEVRRWKRSKVI